MKNNIRPHTSEITCGQKCLHVFCLLAFILSHCLCFFSHTRCVSLCVCDSCVAEESMAASLTQSPLKSFSKNRTLAHIPKRKQCVMLVVSARSLQRSLWEVVIDRAFPSDRRVFAISVLEAHPDLFWHYLCKRDGTLTFYLSVWPCSPSYTHRA